MYGPPRRCKVFCSAVRSSLRKCIRPLASKLLLQPGHDEMRAHRSQEMVRAQEARFFDRAYDAPIDCSDISPWTSQLTNVTLRHVPARSVRRESVGASAAPTLCERSCWPGRRWPCSGACVHRAQWDYRDFGEPGRTSRCHMVSLDQSRLSISDNALSVLCTASTSSLPSRKTL